RPEFALPNVWCKATEHIKEQIELIKKLEKKNYTYKTSDGIYFDTSKLKDYGKLAKLDIKGLKAGKRIGIGEKKNKTDFALWKFSEKPGIEKYPTMEITTTSIVLANQLRDVLLQQGFRVGNIRKSLSKLSKRQAYRVPLYGKSNVKKWL
ncbi:unnamed protein product, partial [marine sediment metagenome]